MAFALASACEEVVDAFALDEEVAWRCWRVVLPFGMVVRMCSVPEALLDLEVPF